MRRLTAQLDRLIDLGVPAAIGVEEDRLRALAAPLLARWDAHPDADAQPVAPAPDDAAPLLILHPRVAPASALVPLLERAGKPGFVVPDMTDLADFAPIDGLVVPDAEVYAVVGVERGDDLTGRTPDDALPELLARGRTPLTIHEGLCWALQEPDVLERNHCFMTVGSRKRAARGLDRRVPALWISGGADRDGGPARRGAPKLGWCWAGNHHTWLGFASAAARVG